MAKASMRQTGGRTRAAIFLAISLLAAVIAAVVIYRLVRSYSMDVERRATQSVDDMVTVVVAAQPLFQGTTIGPQDLAIVEIPLPYVPDGTSTSPEEVQGRVPIERILAGEFIREERLADPEAGVGLNAIIPQGMRAISFNITDGSAVSGFLNPGNYVDILVTLQDPREEELRTLTLEQAIQVIAVDSRMGDGPGQEREGAAAAPSVTLAVSPEQAERLMHANANGAITLTLRNDVDVTEVETNGATAGRLIGRQDAPAIRMSEVKTRTNPDGTMVIILGEREREMRIAPDGTVRGK